jgi:hypothetical protein
MLEGEVEEWHRRLLSLFLPKLLLLRLLLFNLLLLLQKLLLVQ